jgi:hypothetical protein
MDKDDTQVKDEDKSLKNKQEEGNHIHGDTVSLKMDMREQAHKDISKHDREKKYRMAYANRTRTNDIREEDKNN